MSKKKQVADEKQLIDIGGSYSKLEFFVAKNKKALLIGVGAIAVVVGGFLYYNEAIKKPKEIKAEAEIFKAEYFYGLDSLNLALNGMPGQVTGLLEIIDSYGGTKAGNRAKYMVGTIYLKQGKYDEAIDYLKKFSSDDIILGAMALGCIGDAYRELNQSEDAVKYYKKAFEKSKNELTTPMYLKKAAMTYEDDLQDSETALKLYKKIREDWGYIDGYKDITKYIARIETAQSK